MPASEAEVFEHLSASKDTPAEIDFLAYAIFAFQKREWMRHYADHHQNVAPTQADVDNWISNLTAFNFSEMQDAAVNMFDGAARAYLADEMHAAQQDAFRASIIREVKSAGSFWKQLALALTTAILAPVILGVIIGGTILYEKGMFTASGFSHAFTGSAEPAQSVPAPSGKPQG